VFVSWSATKGQQKRNKEAEKKDAIVPPFRDASRLVLGLFGGELGFLFFSFFHLSVTIFFWPC
jgi:hypothetical protein